MLTDEQMGEAVAEIVDALEGEGWFTLALQVRDVVDDLRAEVERLSAHAAGAEAQIDAAMRAVAEQECAGLRAEVERLRDRLSERDFDVVRLMRQAFVSRRDDPFCTPWHDFNPLDRPPTAPPYVTMGAKEAEHLRARCAYWRGMASKRVVVDGGRDD